MATRPSKSAEQNQPDGPPAPGGDPDQIPSDPPAPRSKKDPGKAQEHGKGFGHIGKRETPASEDTPEPHQIY